MGPPIFIGGNLPQAERASVIVARASMGPPIFIGGNLQRARGDACVEIASMGPPIFIGGNAIGDITTRRYGGVLQWGHRFSSVEILLASCDAFDLQRASMGPPIFIGGNSGLGNPLCHCWLRRRFRAVRFQPWSMLRLGCIIVCKCLSRKDRALPGFFASLRCSRDG